MVVLSARASWLGKTRSVGNGQVPAGISQGAQSRSADPFGISSLLPLSRFWEKRKRRVWNRGAVRYSVRKVSCVGFRVGG